MPRTNYTGCLLTIIAAAIGGYLGSGRWGLMVGVVGGALLGWVVGALLGMVGGWAQRQSWEHHRGRPGQAAEPRDEDDSG